MKPKSTRRLFLESAAAVGAAALVQRRVSATSTRAFAVDEIRTISLQSDRYHGWPTLCRRRNGELMVVCSGGRAAHVCPFGRVDMIRSRDDGRTWTYERTILDGPLDDRDAGLVETDQGSLLASTFTSLAYVPTLQKANAAAAAGKPTMSVEELERWQAAHARIPEGEHENHLGCWMTRSEDGGLNWSPAYRVPVDSPHGAINLSDGRLLYPGIALWENERRVAVFSSEDDGKTWDFVSDLPVRAGDDQAQYHELHGVEAADGRLVVQIRNHNPNNAREKLQTHSLDGGATWAEPYSIGVWGLPSHLLRLASGDLLMTYGHRRAPLGNQARISSDYGQTWSEPMVLYGAGTSTDLGYPSTAEIEANVFVTVWYERLQASANAVLRMARWRLA